MIVRGQPLLIFLSLIGILLKFVAVIVWDDTIYARVIDLIMWAILCIILCSCLPIKDFKIADISINETPLTL
jgi:hypothetical protein